MRNKTILITGASRGLGRALAFRWSKENKVINLSRTTDADINRKVEHVFCDLEDSESLTKAFTSVSKNNSTIDLLINNAGVLTSAPAAIMDPKDVSLMIDVNLTAPILLSRLVLRKMMRQKSGNIVNIVSMASKLNIVGDSVYAATKSGLEAFAKVANREGHDFGVHVNNIGVTVLRTGMMENLTQSGKDKIISYIPHRQEAEVEDIAKLIEFLNDNSRDLGGQTIYLGGI